jgi:hypothetical protein
MRADVSPAAHSPEHHEHTGVSPGSIAESRHEGDKPTPSLGVGGGRMLLAELASDLTQNVSPTLISFLLTRATAAGSEPALVPTGAPCVCVCVCVCVVLRCVWPQA